MRKKSRLPAVIFFLLIIAGAGIKTWNEYSTAMLPPKKVAVVASFPIAQVVRSGILPSGGQYVMIPAGQFDAQQSFTTLPVPEGLSKVETVRLLFTFGAMPTDTAAVVDKISETVKAFANENHKIEEIYLSIDTDTPDFEAIYALTHALRQGMHQTYFVSLFIKRSWTDQKAQTNLISLRNLVKSGRFFVFDAPADATEGAPLALVISDYDKFNIPFMLRTRKMPDIVNLKKYMAETAYFVGLLIDEEAGK